MKIRWFVVVLLGTGGGMLLVQYLTVHPLDMSLYLVLTMLVLGAPRAKRAAPIPHRPESHIRRS